MLLEQVKEDIVSGGLGAGNQFTIAASAKAFEVLSSNLYQNKTLAVIREITCNAVDAHRMVGKPVRDIRIEMPSYIAPHFAVRDFGPGLSHDDVLSLYTTYFRSTKDASNDLIGGFGLGSKSPFAVADQFTVTSWQGGEKRTYVCYKDGGVPAINHINSSRSDEPNGLEVRVAVGTGSIYRWQQEAIELFKWWPEVPTGVAKGLEWALAPEVCAVRSSLMVGDYPEWAIAQGTHAPTVLMGGVPYTLAFSAITGMAPDLIKALSGLALVLVFEVGELAISPSREALSYDAVTSKALLRRLANIKREIIQAAEASVATAPTLWEARTILYGNRKASDNQTFKLADLFDRFAGKTATVKWRGQDISQIVRLNLKEDFSAPVTLIDDIKLSHRKTYDRRTYLWDYDHSVQGHKNSAWFWESAITAKTYRKVQATLDREVPDIVDAYGKTSKPQRRGYIVTGIPFDEAEREFTAKGLPPLRKVEDLPDAPKAPRTQSNTSTTKGYLYNVAKGEWERTETAIDLTKAGYWTKFAKGHSLDMPSYPMGQYIKMGIIDTALPIVGISRRQWDTLKFEGCIEKLGWQRLGMDLVQKVPVADIKPAAYAMQFVNRMGVWISDLIAVLRKLDGLVKDPAFSPMVSALVAAYNKSAAYGVLAYADNFSAEQAKANLEGVAEANKLIAEWEAYGKKHPLLKIVATSREVRAADIADYLNR